MIKFVETGDGSKTLYHEGIGENYHSKHGAVQESRHVFVKMGLEHVIDTRGAAEVSVLEVGFGTGLNFLTSSSLAMEREIKLNYLGIEAFPLPLKILDETGYSEYVLPELWESFLNHYEPAMKHSQQLNTHCQLYIDTQKLLSFATEKQFDLLYFDAFAAIHQPEMWTREALGHVCAFLKPGGVFVTYAITGELKRTMKSLGFSIEKLPGAPGKREMLRATKLPQGT